MIRCAASLFVAVVFGSASTRVAAETAPPAAHALVPSLADRTFFQEPVRRWRGPPNPWIDVGSLALGAAGADAEALRQWLVKQKRALSPYPPVYESEQEITSIIIDWQSKRAVAEQIDAAPNLTLELGALATTFWLYGHHVDEPGSSDRAEATIARLKERFRDAALPYMLEGMLLADVGGKGGAAALAAARERAKDSKTKGMIDVAIASHCQRSFRRHQAAVALSHAVDECLECVDEYRGLLSMINLQFGSDPEQPVAEPYHSFTDSGRKWVGSTLFGYTFQLPENWGIDRYVGYQPQKGMSMLKLDGAPLEGSGLVHGLILTAGVPSEGAADDKFALKLIAMMQGKPKAIQIKPLHPNPFLTKWYRVDTSMPVGKDDTITVIVATGVIKPVSWKAAEHVRLAAEEPPCESPFVDEAQSKGDAQSGVDASFKAMRPKGRLNGPVALVFFYNGSKGSYEHAAKTFQAMVASLQIEPRATSDVVNALGPQARSGGESRDSAERSSTDRPSLEVAQDYCDKGEMRACADLGFRYFSGNYGAEKDLKKARMFFAKGCDGKEAQSCFGLAGLYANALGVELDMKKAAAYLKKACAFGLEEGCKMREQVLEELKQKKTGKK